MNKLQLREAIAKQSSRFDLVGSTNINGIDTPDYTVDRGVDGYINKALKILANEVKCRRNLKSFVGTATSSIPGIAIPNKIVSVKDVSLNGKSLHMETQDYIHRELGLSTTHTGTPKFWFTISAPFVDPYIPDVEPVPEDVIPISTIEQLQLIGFDEDYPADGTYMLTQDIDATDTINWNGGKGFEVISDMALSGFTGSFDGRGYSIINLYINRADEEEVGLFRVIDGEVKNLHLVGAIINGGYSTGGLSAYAWANAVITNCTVSGTVNGIGLTDDVSAGCVGGLLGGSSGATVEDCYTTCTVTATGNNVGGVIGWHINNPISVALGSHTSRCFATGDVFGKMTVGGLVGYHTKSSVLNNCFATGAVSGERLIGGLIGLTNYSARTTRCYAVGTVTATYIDPGPVFTSGPLVGAVWSQNDNGMPVAIVSNSYYNSDNVAENLEGLAGTGKTTEQLQRASTYEGWDFNNVWEFLVTDYPTLRAFIIPAIDDDAIDIGVYPIPSTSVTLRASVHTYDPVVLLTDENWFTTNYPELVVDLACAEIAGAVMDSNRKIVDYTVERIKKNILAEDITEEIEHLGAYR